MTNQDAAVVNGLMLAAIGRIEGELYRGRLIGAPVGTLSTGSANPAIVFQGVEFVAAGWRQGRGTIDPTGANNGLVWECIIPGETGDLTPMTRSVHYDGAKVLTFAPRDSTRIVTINLVPGVARSLAVSQATWSATITFIAGTTTYAQILADWNASLLALDLATLTGTTGTLPATFDGGVFYLSRAPLVEYVQAASTAVGWDATTRVLTVGLDIAGGGDSVANIKSALAASASHAEYVFQLRDAHGSTGAGDVTTGIVGSVIGGAGSAQRRAQYTMAQGSNKDLVVTAREAGPDAVPVYFELVDVATADPPVVDVTTGELGYLVRVSAKVATSTALHVLQALRDSYDAMSVCSARLKVGSTGAGAPSAISRTVLTGGEDGDGSEAWAGTVAGTIMGVTDDTATVSWPALGTTHPADGSVEVLIRLCGVLHRCSLAVVA